MAEPTLAARLLARVAGDFALICPLVPTYALLVVSALFPIYAGAHASLSRPSSAARPRKRRSTSSTSTNNNASTSDSDSDDAEDDDDESGSDEDASRASVPPSVAPTRSMPRRAATKKVDMTPMKLEGDDDDDEEEEDDEEESTPVPKRRGQA